MSDAEFIDDDFGDDFDGDLSEDFEDVESEYLTPEVLAYLERDAGGTNRGNLEVLYSRMNEQNRLVTSFWNEISETTRRAWKNLLDAFGSYITEHNGLIGTMGSEVSNHIYYFIHEYLRIKKLIDAEIARAHQQTAAARAARPASASTASTPSRSTPVPASQPTQPSQASTPSRPARQASGRRLSTLPSTNAAFQNAASGFTVAKVLPWLLAAGVAWYVYTNRRTLFA